MENQYPRINYELKHNFSRQGVAFYTPTLKQDMPLAEATARLACSPMDIFLHRYVLDLLVKAEDEEIQKLADNHELRPVLAELALRQPERKDRLALPAPDEELALRSPETELRGALQPASKQAALVQQVADNIFHHHPLPPQKDLRSLAAETIQPLPRQNLATLRKKIPLPPPLSRPPAMETYKKAMGILYGLGLVSGPEMRHLSSLSPWGLLRQWRLNTTVNAGRNNLALQGLMTSYGRGLELEQARVSLAMEMVERLSAFASFDEREVVGTQNQLPLVRGSYEQVAEHNALHPDSLAPEIPYMGQKIYWVPAEKKDAKGQGTALVPAQTVFLFTNLDEPALFCAAGSTGLASGNTLEEAKLGALLEILERDSEAVSPYTPATCFRLQAEGGPIGDLLRQYQEKNIDLCFQDITGHIGVPAFKAFVQAKDGAIIKATAADLDAKNALVAAMTELPWPFPDSPASATGPKDLPTKDIREFPSFDTASAKGNLALLETALVYAGHEIFYVDISRKDIRLPVVRALVTGLDYMASFDQPGHLPQRLLTNIPGCQNK